MSRHPPIFIVHSVNLWGTMRRTVGLMTSCMKGQGMHIKFKEEEASLLTVGLEEEDKEEAWV
jgi:hypothetical protein